MNIDAVFAPEALPRGRMGAGARANRSGQRVIDLILAIPLVVLLSPMLGIIALSVWINDGGPAFYGQMRIGRHGHSFRCWKFRSMVTDSDAVLARVLEQSAEARAEWARDHKLRMDPRITWVGRFLRSSSLDELPQLWNVLCGEMSLVGPRPIVVAEVGRYGARFHDYCTCRPGITGLWQVSGRNDVSYRRRVAIDAVYARTASVGLDLAILARTIPAVLLRRGSY